MRMVEHAKELLSDIARHRADLIGLPADLDITPDRMKKCAAAADDLESVGHRGNSHSAVGAANNS